MSNGIRGGGASIGLKPRGEGISNIHTSADIWKIGVMTEKVFELNYFARIVFNLIFAWVPLKKIVYVTVHCTLAITCRPISL